VRLWQNDQTMLEDCKDKRSSRIKKEKKKNEHKKKGKMKETTSL